MEVETDSERLRPAWAEVDLDALGHNLGRIRRRVEGARVMAVVKADAYGHGARRVGLALDAAGVDWLGVAMAEEGAELRRAGVETPILVLDPVGQGQLELFDRHRLTPSVTSLQQLGLWLERTAGVAGPPRACHLMVDTGMSRLGLGPGEVATALERIRASKGIALGGLATHFASSDELDNPRNDLQEEAFRAVLAELTQGERSDCLIHMANSAAALHCPSSHASMVRVGLALYGVDPARVEGELEPVLSVKAKLVQVRDVAAGTAAGYNARWRASRPSRLGVLPLGYGDGYPWRLTGQAEALLAGARVPVVGAVSMDLLIVDLTGREGALGDEVVLLGAAGDDAIDAWQWADWAGTIPYEILTGIGLRLHRRYSSEGRVVGVVSRHGKGAS